MNEPAHLREDSLFWSLLADIDRELQQYQREMDLAGGAASSKARAFDRYTQGAL